MIPSMTLAGAVGRTPRDGLRSIVPMPRCHLERVRSACRGKANRVRGGRRRGIAQPGSAGVLGTPGRRFKSCCPDQLIHSNERRRRTMTARIYKPAKTAMQSGHAKTKEWVLDYEPEQPREIEPLMGWTSSGDMRQQVQLRFDTQEEAVAYCDRLGIPDQVFQSKPPVRRGISYADNFAFNRRDPWTH